MTKPELHSLECKCGVCAVSARRRTKSDALRLAAAVCALASLVLLAAAARLQLDTLAVWH